MSRYYPDIMIGADITHIGSDIGKNDTGLVLATAIGPGHGPTRIFRRRVVTVSEPTYQVLPPWSAGVWRSRWPRPDMLNR